MAVSVAFAVAPVHAAEVPREPPPAIELVHEDRLESGGFMLREVEYVLDGRPLSARVEGEGQGVGRQLEVTPGRHVLGVRAVYVGHSPVFGYVEGYRFLMQGRVTFDALPGWVVRIRSTGFEREGLTVQWEQRPAFKLEGEPRRAILAIERGPVEHEPMSGTGQAVMPVAYKEPGRARATAEEKARQVIAEVLAEAHRRAPLETCALAPVYFDFADTRLKPEAEAVLRRLSECLVRQSSLRLRIQGHSDARGAESFNDSLGQGRAQTVAGFLMEQGVPRSRLMLESAGEVHPACTDDTPECYARSRRVELIVEAPAH